MEAAADNPYRYVLSDDAPLLKNLSALWTIEPALAEQIEALHPVEPYPVQPSKAGPPTVSVPAADGRIIWLHSRYQPVTEAQRLTDPIDVANCVVFYIFGLGLGYHLELLFEKASGEAIFCIFEPDLRLLRTAFEHHDVSKLIESRRVMFFTRADKGELLTRLTPHSALISIGSAHLEHPPSMEIAGDFHRQMQTWLEEFTAFSRTSLNTVVLNSRRTAENISRNLAWYVATPSLSRLHDRFKGKPAVVISAGPSLRKNKHLLKGLENRAVLIAVQTMLQPLLEMGIEPQFVTSLDYHEICTRFFEKLPPKLNTELIAEPKANSAIFGMYPGPISLLGNPFAESLLRELKLGKTQLTGGATVAHLAFYLAEHLGCDPIIFVGQDLGFSDGLFYSPGTSYEDVWRPEFSRFCTVEMKQWEQIVRERFLLRKVPDQQGRPLYTEERMFTYLQQFERDFLKSKAQVIDATEGGAAKRGSTVMSLADSISKFCRAELPRAAPDYPSPRWERVARCIESIARRLQEAREIEQISRQTLPKLEEIRDHIEDQLRVNRAISQIDPLRARMNELGATYELITELTQTSQLNRFTADRKISADKVDGIAKQRRQVARDVDNVRAVLEAAKDFQDLAEKAIERLQRDFETPDRRAAA